MSDYNMTFEDVIGEIFTSGYEYIKENCDSSYRFCAVKDVAVLKRYDENGNSTIIDNFKITPSNIGARYKRFVSFFKKDLISGMIVKTRNGDYQLVTQIPLENEIGIFSLVNENSWGYLCNYYDNLKHTINSEYDIVGIYKIFTPNVLAKFIHCRNVDEVENIISCNLGTIKVYNIN